MSHFYKKISEEPFEKSNQLMPSNEKVMTDF